jgi:multidrug efflux system outer membrane protein
MSRRTRIAPLLLAALANACMVGPDYRPPEETLPSQWGERAAPSEAAQPAAEQATMWWTVFNDPELTALLESAAHANLDLQQAAARIRAARAQRTIAGAPLWPNVVAQGSYARQHSSANAPGLAEGQTYDLYQIGFDATWELDVFGGNRRALEAADARLEASQFAWADVLVSLLGEVGGDYVVYRSLQQRIRIAAANEKTQRETLALTQRLYAAGLASDLDVARAQSQVATTAATIPPLTAQAQQVLHALGVLLGDLPMALTDELSPDGPIPRPPAVTDVGVPSDVLLRRPDVRRSERALAASTADIGVATRDLYPRVFLTGFGALQSVSAGELFDWTSRAASIGPSVSWTVFDAGLTRARVALTTAQQEEALDAYRGVVLEALQEVEDGLVAYAQDQVRRDDLTTAVAANQRAADLALQLYIQGLTDFLSVLQAQLNLFTSQDQLAQTQRDMALDVIGLYKSLGGGWEAGPNEMPRFAGAPPPADS